VRIHFNAAKSKNYTTPRCAGITLCVAPVIRLYMKSAVPNKSSHMIQGPVRYLYPVLQFTGKLFLKQSLRRSGTTNSKCPGQNLKCCRKQAGDLAVHFNLDSLIDIDWTGNNLCGQCMAHFRQVEVRAQV
jgi:hypothetical protein